MLASLLFVVVHSAAFSQPAQAESFLFKTVRCLTGVILPVKCIPDTSSDGSVTPSTTPDSTKQPSKPQHQPSTSTPSPSSNAGKDSAEPAVVQRGSGIGGAPIDLPKYAPIEVQYVSERIPQGTKGYDFPRTSDTNAVFYTYGSGRYVKPSSYTAKAFIEPSQQGWKIAGFTWYWWVLIIGGLTGVFWYLKRRYLKKN